MAHDFDFYRGRYAHFSVQWSDQKSIRDLVSSILREPPNIARMELGCEPYILGKLLRSSFQQFLRLMVSMLVEEDMLVLVLDGQIRESSANCLLLCCGGHQKLHELKWVAYHICLESF